MRTIKKAISGDFGSFRYRKPENISSATLQKGKKVTFFVDGKEVHSFIPEHDQIMTLVVNYLKIVVI